MAYIDMISYECADESLKAIYNEIIHKRGKLANVHTIQSLHPETILKHIDLYMEIMFGCSPLTRAQREMLAVVVSYTNHCPYCISHHSQALFHLWKDKEKVSLLTEDIKEAGLTNIDFLLCMYAIQLTKEPHRSTEQLIQEMKQNGLSDRAILDATLIVGYFNFVNRIVLGLGVELEHDGGAGYKY
jgi:uncharacterized peroxidase-related enzyme